MVTVLSLQYVNCILLSMSINCSVYINKEVLYVNSYRIYDVIMHQRMHIRLYNNKIDRSDTNEYGTGNKEDG